jgi:hypothetical protein
MATRKSIPKISPAPSVVDAPIADVKAEAVIAPEAISAPAAVVPKKVEAAKNIVAVKKAVAPKKVAAKKASPPVTSAKRVPSAPAASTPIALPKAAKEKLVRDSFTMPRSDFSLIDQLKERALGFKRPTKKSELLRAGLQALSALNDAKLKAALEALAPIKTGRPKANAK